MLNHCGQYGGLPPPPREHFENPNGSPILNAKYARKKYGRSAQSGRRTSFISSSPRPKWLNRKLRDRSRSTSWSAGHDGAASRGSSNSFPIHAENRFSVARFQVLRKGQTLPRVALGGSDLWLRTAISRVIVLHSAGARSRASVARHVPAAGDLTSANQKYGGPPCRSRDLAATFPSGAISASSPSSGLSAAKTTRKGAPFHGPIGEARTGAAATAFLRGREFRVATQVQLPGGAGLIDVAADGVHLARRRIDIRDPLAMGAPDRARVGAAVELCPDAPAHRLVAGVGERRLA